MVNFTVLDIPGPGARQWWGYTSQGVSIVFRAGGAVRMQGSDGLRGGSQGVCLCIETAGFF